jgi:hypothetical protein
MRWYTYIAMVALFPLSFYGYIFVTEGFDPHTVIASPLQFVQCTTPFDGEVAEAISRSYSYGGSGSQSFCCISDNGRYVVKFFKSMRQKDRFYEYLFFPSYRKAIRKRRDEANQAAHMSSIIAHKELQSETALLALHLGTEPCTTKRLTVRDRLGRLHMIDLNRANFVIQKRAIPTSEWLTKARAAGQHDRAADFLKELFTLVVHRRRLGYNDKDPHLIRNFGYLDGKAVEIDIGGFYIDRKKDERYFIKYELPKISKKLLPWLRSNYPELTPVAKRILVQINDKGVDWEPTLS